MNTSQPRTKTGRRLRFFLSVATIGVALGVAAGIAGIAMSGDATATPRAAGIATSPGAPPLNPLAQPGIGLHVWTQTTAPTSWPRRCKCRIAPDRLPLADLS